ncbi:hypothetical protein V3C99_003533, partial [Haemonchus contortus]
DSREPILKGSAEQEDKKQQDTSNVPPYLRSAERIASKERLPKGSSEDKPMKSKEAMGSAEAGSKEPVVFRRPIMKGKADKKPPAKSKESMGSAEVVGSKEPQGRRLSREATISDREEIHRKKKGKGRDDKSKRRTDAKKLKMKSKDDATINEGSEGSDESETESEEIEVLIPEELREYAEKLIIGKLSRHGFGRGRISKLALYCVTICYVANLQNFMMFNYAVRRFGLTFIFPFVCCMTLIGFPMIYLEMALGQYTQGTVLPLFDRIAPISVGVGISASLLLMTSIFIDNDVMGRMVHILLKSLDIFGTEPTWDDCVGEGVREFCHSINRNCTGIKTPKGWVETDTSERFIFRLMGDTCILPTVGAQQQRYTRRSYLKIHGKIMDLFDTLPLVHYGLATFENFETLIAFTWPDILSLTYITACFCFIAYLLSHRRRFVVSMVYLYVFTVFLLSSTLLATFLYLSPPEQALSKGFILSFGDLRHWVNAVVYSILLPQLGFGGMVFIGSQNVFFNDLVIDAMVVTVLTTVLYAAQGCMYAISVNTFMLDLADGNSYTFYYSNLHVADYSKKSNRSNTSIYSVFLASMHIFGDLQVPLSVLATVTGLMASITTKIMRVEALFSTIMDYTQLVPNKAVRTAVLYIICLAGILFSFIPFCSDCALDKLGFTTNTMPAASVIIVLCELLVVCFFYGTQRVASNVTTMTVGKAVVGTVSTTDYYYQIVSTLLWAGLIPIVLFLTAYLFIMDEQSNFETSDNLLLIILLCPIPLCAIYRIWYFYRNRMNPMRLFKPDAELWGPRSTAHRQLAERNERLARIY